MPSAGRGIQILIQFLAIGSADLQPQAGRVRQNCVEDALVPPAGGVFEEAIEGQGRINFQGRGSGR
jgi:hypothetical protein